MESKSPLWLSVIAILIAFATFVHSFLVTEFGVLIGNEGYDLYVNEHLRIYNTVGPLILKPTVIVRNDGTRPLRINKVRALLQLGSESHILTSDFVANISPQSVWSGDIQLEEDLTEGDVKLRDELNMDITKYLIEQWKKTKNKEVPIVLSQDYISRVEAILDSNASWMKHDDNYFFLLLLWVNKDEHTPSERRLSKFKFNSFQRTMITDYQLNAYSAPRSDIIPANLFVTFFAKTKMESIQDSEQKVRRFQEYRRLSRE